MKDKIRELRHYFNNEDCKQVSFNFVKLIIKKYGGESLKNHIIFKVKNSNSHKTICDINGATTFIHLNDLKRKTNNFDHFCKYCRTPIRKKINTPVRKLRNEHGKFFG